MSRYEKFFPGETILHHETAFWMKGVLNVKTGTVILTDKRLAFVEKKILAGGGLLVHAADAALGVSRPKLKVDIEIDQIKSWTKPKKMDILVETKSGETYKIRKGKGTEIEDQLQEMVSN